MSTSKIALALSGQSGSCANFLPHLPASALVAFTGSEIFPQLQKKARSEPGLFLSQELAPAAVIVRSFVLWNALDDCHKLNVKALLPNSLGEFTALLLSQMLSPAQVLDIVTYRTRLMEDFFAQTPMVTFLVRTAASTLEKLLSIRNYCVAAILSPRCVLVSGPRSNSEEVKKVLRDLKIPCLVLSNRCGFHHPLMQAISAPLYSRLAQCNFQQPRMLWRSNATGEEITIANVADLLSKQLYSTVLFENSVRWASTICSHYIDLDSEGFLTARINETLTNYEMKNLGKSTAAVS